MIPVAALRDVYDFTVRAFGANVRPREIGFGWFGWLAVYA
jgi:hypothetical protein